MRKIIPIRIILLSIILFGLVVCWIALPSIFFKLGVAAFNKKDYAAAYKQFSYARILNKTNTDYRYYYVQTLAKFMPSMKIQKEMYEFANDGKKDSAHVFAGIQVNVWRNNAMQTYGSNYIEQAPLGADIIRWNPKTFPLKVYSDFSANPNYPEYYNDQITKAFGQWAGASGFIAFSFINNPTKADIIISFKPSPESGCTETGCKYVVAHTEPIIKGRILKQMVITIYDKDATGSFFSDKELYNTVLHEIGHALGIMGHSYSTDDLMYMSNKANLIPTFIQYRSDFQYISVKDVSTLKLLYNIMPTISNTPLSEINEKKLLYGPVIFGNMKMIGARKVKEAKEYIAQAPNLPGGYMDLGIAYDDMGNVEKALEAFQKAYNLATLDNDRYTILYNIAAMYLNNNNPDSALGYANQAKQIKATDEIAELIGNIEHAKNAKTKPFWVPRIVPNN